MLAYLFHRIAFDLAVFPNAGNGLTAASAEAAEGAVLPGRRQGGQKLDLFALALEKHFGNRGASAEVSVDLEGGMSVEKVGKSAFFMDGGPW